MNYVNGCVGNVTNIDVCSIPDDIHVMCVVVLNIMEKLSLIGCWFAAGKVNSRWPDHSQRELTAKFHGPSNFRGPTVADEN